MKVVLALASVLFAVAGPAMYSDARSPASRRAVPQDPAPVVQGREAFERNCAACHGKGPSEGRVPLLPGTFALSLKYKGELPAALEDRTDLTPELIETVVRYGIFSMPPLRKTEVSDQELNAIAAYLQYSAKHTGSPISTGPNKVSGGRAN